MWNTHRNDHDVPGYVLLCRISLDLPTHTGPADRLYRLTVGIVLACVLEFAPNQKRSCAPDHEIGFGNVVMSPAVQGLCRRPGIEMEEIRAEIVALRDHDDTRRMIAICFHQRFEVCMGNEGKRSRLGRGRFSLLSLALALTLSVSRSQNAH